MSGLVAVLLLQLAGALGGGAPRDHAEHHRAALGANGSENEYLFYQFAAAAYCSDSALDAWSCMPCLKANQTVRSLKRFENTSTDIKSYVAALDDGSPRIVVGFRGTETLTNWIENLRLATTDRNMSCAGCKVHHGFLDAFLSVAPGVLAEVHRLQALWPGAPLFTTGHSLGAALATLCAYTMEYVEIAASLASRPGLTYGGGHIGMTRGWTWRASSPTGVRELATPPSPTFTTATRALTSRGA
jgi:hypothetical protein